MVGLSKFHEFVYEKTLLERNMALGRCYACDGSMGRRAGQWATELEQWDEAWQKDI